MLVVLANQDAPETTRVDRHIGVPAQQLVVGMVDHGPEARRDTVTRHLVEEGGVKCKVLISDGNHVVVALDTEAWRGTSAFADQLVGGEESPEARCGTALSGRRHGEDGCTVEP